MALVAVVAACIVTSWRVPIVSRRVDVGGIAVRRITVTVAIRWITVTVAIRWITVTVAIRWITVIVAIRWIAVTVCPRPQRAADYSSSAARADPATQTPRLRRLGGSKGCCGNTGSRDNGRDRLTHGVLQDVAYSETVRLNGRIETLQ